MSFGDQRLYTEEERKIICDDYDAGVPTPETVAKLNALPSTIERGLVRTAEAMRAARCRMRLSSGHAERISRFEQPVSHVREDEAFQSAMMLAVMCGTETPPLGVVKDDTPFAGKIIRPDPNISICGSFGQMCAESADAEDAPSDMAPA